MKSNSVTSFEKDLPRNIPAKFGKIWPCGLGDVKRIVDATQWTTLHAMTLILKAPLQHVCAGELKLQILSHIHLVSANALSLDKSNILSVWCKVNHLPEDKISTLSISKAFTNHKLNVTQTLHLTFTGYT